jgi:EAL domain-containing protein (putative c-di-GMP-specific phosphodiesterase class I)
MIRERESTQSERELVDTIERGGRTPAGRTAVHLHLSRLLASNRPAAYLRIAARLFAPLEVTGQVQVFALTNGDIVVLGRDMPEDEVDRIVHRVRSLFEKDPLAFEDFDDEGYDPFVTWYAFEVDFDEVVEVARSLLAMAEARRQEGLGDKSPAAPLHPGDLDDLADRVRALNVRQALRRQPCIRIANGRTGHVLFDEFTVSMAEVGQAVAPETDLFADRWLFQEFSRTLDQQILAALPAAGVLPNVPRLSVNLNLETVGSPPFRGLAAALDGRSLVVEVQVIDVFTNLTLYQAARESLRADGHAILIDGLSPAVLGAMDLGLLDPDFVKILWTADLAAPQHPRKGEGLADLIVDLGVDRVILSRCESEAAVTWGQDRGITAFQGRFMDAILATMTMHGCPASAACSLRQCTDRRGSAMGGTRAQCPNPSALDGTRTIVTPGRARDRQES